MDMSCGTQLPFVLPIKKTARPVFCEGKDGEPCTSRANYDEEGGIGRWCAKCKKPHMLNVRSKRCENCNKQAYFDVPGGKGRFCKAHADESGEDMVDVNNKKMYAMQNEARYTRCSGRKRFTLWRMRITWHGRCSKQKM